MVNHIKSQAHFNRREVVPGRPLINSASTCEMAFFIVMDIDQKPVVYFRCRNDWSGRPSDSWFGHGAFSAAAWAMVSDGHFQYLLKRGYQVDQ